MGEASQRKVAQAVLATYGRTFAEELGISVDRNTPSELFKLLVAAMLFSTRISNRLATQAARALFKQGWTTPAKMAGATWRQRTDVLNRAGYARYDESTSRMLGDTADHLLRRYQGDLRRLRDEAERDPQRERELLKQCKGIGDVGADIFCREAQVAWTELRPFVDKKARQAAERLGLPTEPRALARLVRQDQVAALVAGLVRCDLAKDYETVRRAA
ncbi:MAG: hypothetical protein ACODAQ_03990 [Phycisphaeraceae bacterium]